MKLLRSIRFNLILGALITLSAAVGTLIPQMSDAPEKAELFTQNYPQWSRLFNFFGFFDLYHTWWFLGLLGLMAFDIVLCKLWNKPPDIGIVSLPPEMTGEEELERHLNQKNAALKLKPYQTFFTSPLSLEDSIKKTKDVLSAQGYRLHDDFSAPSGTAFVATKHAIQRWGSYFAHIGLVVILAGALIKSLFGFVEMVPVLEGHSRAMQNKPWNLTVDKFTIKYYNDGTHSPSSFESILRVDDGSGKTLGEKTIHVNDPLDIGGVRFYQATWGAGGMFRSVTLQIAKEKVVIPQRKPVSIPGTPFKVEADVMMPNFSVNGGQADTGSLDLKNPAVRVNFSIGPHKTAPLWLFENDPTLCLAEDTNGNLGRVPPPPFKLTDIDPILFSGIQVAYDPGFKVVLAGALMWLVGVLSIFYMHRRRLWVLIEPALSARQFSIGGWSSRGNSDFDEEFSKTAELLRAQLGSSCESQVLHNPITEATT